MSGVVAPALRAVVTARRRVRSTERPPLRYDVFVAPELPFNGPPPRVANADPSARSRTGSNCMTADWLLRRLKSVNDIVLVHGGFVDGSGWSGVYNILKGKGFNVSIVQNPTISLEGDVAAAKLIIDKQPNPVILVGHSYGGAVITEAGTDPKVAGLVYITAFAPDKGESVNTLIANPPPGAPVPPILPPIDGYLFLDKEKFQASFAGDVDAETAAFMAASQVP
jgi:pimeloyl-ACP methyl ester carboxylesterase